MNLEEGRLLVRFARKTVEHYLTGVELPDSLVSEREDEKRGVFVSLHTHPDHQLRGCIGFPLPVYFLHEAVKKAALSAAFGDPRFDHLHAREFPNVVFEVSVLSVPKEIEAKPEAIKVGRDGLIIEHRGHSGLLLPQVPGEFGWDETEFLENVCRKAGLPPGAWKHDGVVLKSFQANVFEETEPDGEVEEK
ncbi:MAG: TIGR00296 family protein [Candidatus Micrarchaeota archaeon]